MGKGDHTRLWLDRWSGSIPLKDVFPDLYALECDKSCKIASRALINSANGIMWNWSWYSLDERLRLSSRIKELEEVLSHVNLSDSEDKWLWEGDISGCFSVK